MLSLNVIRDQGIPPMEDILQPLDSYEKLVTFIHDPRFIRIGTRESVRTVELAVAFNNTMRENVAHTSTFPRLMKQFIADYSTLSIIKKVKNYGTIYEGIGLTTDPVPQEGKTILLQKEVNDKYLIRDRAFLNEIKKTICHRCHWTDNQYRQMGALGLICLIRDGRDLDVDITVHITIGRLFEYIHERNIKLRNSSRYALNIKFAFEKAIGWDGTLSKDNGTPVYTNRLLIAEETYDAGEKLQRAINSYTNRIQSLPTVNIRSNPNIEELNDLVGWLKSNSMHKTRIDMRIQQEAADPETPQAVNWTMEGEIKYHISDTQLETKD